jgi:hypothetical protein
MLRPGTTYVAAAAPYVLLGAYLPALLLVLRRPNRGDVPPWIDAVLHRLARHGSALRLRSR